MFGTTQRQWALEATAGNPKGASEAVF